MKVTFRRQSGIGFIEVLIALAILAVFAVTFLSGLVVSSQAVIIADKKVTAESIARSQIESIRIEGYHPVLIVNEVATYETTFLSELDVSTGYSVWSLGRNGVELNSVVGVPWNSTFDIESSTDFGLQKITVIIKKHLHDEVYEEILRLESFTVDK